MSATRFLVLAFLLVRCGAESTTQAAAPVKLAHHVVRADQLPLPYDTHSAANPSRIVKRPANASLQMPPGFHIAVYAEDLDEPRNMALAPNGDIFVAETGAGRITILRGKQRFAFARDLDQPFGLAFAKGFLYVGNESAVVRFPYVPGQTAARI